MAGLTSVRLKNGEAYVSENQEAVMVELALAPQVF